MIYLDNNATTPIDPTALEAMRKYQETDFANPSSGYLFARGVKKAVSNAREQLANLLGCHPEEVVFTSGGTEADNASLFSATELYPDRKHVVTCGAEHDAVLRYCEWLSDTRGYEITDIGVDSEGLIDLDALEAAIRPGQTAMVSLMWGNNETGVINNIPRAAELAASRGVLFHTDAVQVVGKIPTQLKDRQIHYLALSGHKFHAPKGIGALYVNKNVRYQPWMLGGGQENRRRAGTENVAGIVALGQAAEMAQRHMDRHGPKHDPILKIREHFEANLRQIFPLAEINGHPTQRTPNTINVRIPGCDAQAMILLLDQRGICVSAGSACHSGSLHPSHVLEAMGRSAEAARECLRISFSRFNTMADADNALAALKSGVEKLRAAIGA